MLRKLILLISFIIVFVFMVGSTKIVAVAKSNTGFDSPPSPNINQTVELQTSEELQTASNVSCIASENDIQSESSKTLDFEDLDDQNTVGILYGHLGLEFFGAVILSQGVSLNYLEYPPHSGLNVIYDDPDYSDHGRITIFLNPAITGNVLKVGGHVTGNRNVSMTAYDYDDNILGSVETGGANYSSIGVPNKLLEISTTTHISKVEFFNGGESGNTYTVDDFFFSSEQTCQIPGVPLYKQANAAWANNDYGGSVTNPWLDPKKGSVAKVKDWGCALTSAAMIVSYHGQKQNGFTTNPGLLNDWLRNNNGYTGGLIYWGKVAEYARRNGVSLYFHDKISYRDDGLVNTFMCSNWPIILNTQTSPYKGHWVVATGQIQSGWNINDPGYYSLTTLPNTSYAGFATYSDSSTGVKSLTIVALTNQGIPATANDSKLLEVDQRSLEFLITDPAGRKTGFDHSSNIYVNEILDASYSIDLLGSSDGSYIEALVFQLGAPLPGEYLIEIFGSGSETYEMEFLAYDEAGNSSKAQISGVIFENTEIDLELNYSEIEGSQVDVEIINSTLSQIFLPLVGK